MNAGYFFYKSNLTYLFNNHIYYSECGGITEILTAAVSKPNIWYYNVVAQEIYITYCIYVI